MDSRGFLAEFELPLALKMKAMSMPAVPDGVYVGLIEPLLDPPID